MSRQQANPPVAAASRAYRDNHRRQARAVSDEKLEVAEAEMIDVDNRFWVMVISGCLGKHAGMRGGGQRVRGVEDGIGPRGDAIGIGNRGPQQALRVVVSEGLITLQGLRKGSHHPPGVLPQQVHLGGIGAELRRPFDAERQLEAEPARRVFYPHRPPVMVLILVAAQHPVFGGTDQPLHQGAASRVSGTVGALRVINDGDHPRAVFFLWMRASHLSPRIGRPASVTVKS